MEKSVLLKFTLYGGFGDKGTVEEIQANCMKVAYDKSPLFP